jgi:hypothetical protein
MAAATRKPPSHPLTAVLFLLGGSPPSLTGLVLTRRDHQTESDRDLLARAVDPRRIPKPLYVANPGIAFMPDLLARLVSPGTPEHGENQLPDWHTRRLLDSSRASRKNWAREAMPWSNFE